MSDTRKGLFDQIASIANENTVANLLLFTKVNEPLITQISTLIASKSIAGYIDLEGYLVWAGTLGGQAAIDKLGLEGSFSLKNEELILFFNDHSRLIIDSVDEYTKKWIASQIQQGKVNRSTPYEISQSLISEASGISKVRAERIAITELAYAMALVESEASARLGIEEHIWRTSKDELVCPICLPLDGEVTGIKQDFPGGYTIPAHPSCRCFYEDVIPKAWDIDNVWLGQ